MGGLGKAIQKSKVFGKSRSGSNSGTHAHYAGEFAGVERARAQQKPVSHRTVHKTDIKPTVQKTIQKTAPKKTTKKTSVSSPGETGSRKTDTTLSHTEHELNLKHTRDAAITAAANGDMRGLINALDKHITLHGLTMTTDEPKRGHVVTRPDSELSVLGVLGYRDTSGQITISESAKKTIEEFGKASGGLKIQEAIDHHIRNRDENYKRIDELTAHVAGVKNSEERKQILTQIDKIVENSSESNHALQSLARGKQDMHLMMHEALHGFSPLGVKNAYVGHGAQIEEITTEVAARFIMHQSFGAEVTHFTGGSYNSQVHAVTLAVAELAGKTPDDAFHDLHSASMEFKKRAASSLVTSDEVRQAFSSDISRVIGKSYKEVDETLRKYLDSVPITD